MLCRDAWQALAATACEMDSTEIPYHQIWSRPFSRDDQLGFGLLQNVRAKSSTLRSSAVQALHAQDMPVCCLLGVLANYGIINVVS